MAIFVNADLLPLKIYIHFRIISKFNTEKYQTFQTFEIFFANDKMQLNVACCNNHFCYAIQLIHCYYSNKVAQILLIFCLNKRREGYAFAHAWMIVSMTMFLDITIIYYENFRIVWQSILIGLRIHLTLFVIRMYQ